MTKIVLSAALLCLFASCASIDSNVNTNSLSVITGTQVTYSLSSAILSNTGIEVINVPDDGRKLASLKDYIERRKDRFEAVFADAEAVVALTNILPADPLFRFAREANIHIVNIDAAQPWSYDVSGVTVVESPTSTISLSEKPNENSDAQSSEYFWLSLSNAVRMADIVGTDLARVFPNQKSLIIENRDMLKQSLLNLSRDYQSKFIHVEDTTVFALANEFVSLTNDLGLYVDGYFLKQDIDWTESDLQQLTQTLKDRKIKVVIHKWQPKQEILDAIQQAGAQLVVLDTSDPGLVVDRRLVVDGYQQILRKNLQLLFNALAG